jgi:glycosyltransferase involved in cell wall biosynthesis
MTEKTSVVVVCDWFDPAFRAGGPVQSLVNLVTQLHDHYSFSIICGNLDYGSDNALPVPTGIWIDWNGMARVMYLDNKTLSRTTLFSILNENVSEKSVLYVQGIFSRYFSIYPILWWHRSKHRKIVVAPRGMLHRSARSVKPFKKTLFLTLARLFGWFNNIDWQSTQPDETKEIRAAMGKKAKIMEAANIPRSIPPYQKRNDYGEPLKILSVGRISDEKDPAMLVHVLGRLAFPAEATVIGDYSDEDYFNQFNNLCNQLPDHVKVTHIRAVSPSDMGSFYRDHHVFVSCSKGENFGHAIAEALSYGLPCFIGENTPWTGLKERQSGEELPLEPAVFEAALNAYHQLSFEEKAEMSHAAHNFAVEFFQPEKFHKQYKALFNIEDLDDE